jgi:hypothetical protein
MQNPSTPTAAPTSSKPHSSRLRWRLILWLFVALLLLPQLWVGIAGYQTYRTLRQLAGTLRTVETPAMLPALQPQVRQLERNLIGLERSLTPLMPLFRQLTFVPRYGPFIATVDDWVASAAHVVALAEQGVGVIQAAQVEQSNDAYQDWWQLGPLLASLSDELMALEEEIDALPLPSGGALRQQMSGFHGAIELAAVAAELGNEWPQLLGERRPATYLVLVQNNHELRATGGFISALAPVTFVDGRMQPVEFVDSYTFFSTDLTYPPAPAPMRTYMDIKLLTLRDANWSPNFPTAAALVRTLYQQHTGLAVDGVITVDLDAIALLLPAFGHLTLPGTTVPITQANIEQAMVQLWNNPLSTDDITSDKPEGEWWRQRKDFMGQLSSVAFTRLQQRSFDPVALAGGIVAALDRRAVQVYLFDPAVQQPWMMRGWDGGLHPQAKADFLAVVDANLGYNKVDAVVMRQLDYRVTWPADATQGAEATLILTYSHTLNRADPVCKATSYYGTRYEEMMARCYFDYSRVYVPAGSELLEVEGWIGNTVTTSRGEHGTMQFGGYFVLNPGSRHQVTLRYRLPAHLRPENYQLVVQRQSGTDPLPIRLSAGTAVHEDILVEGSLTWTPTAP